MGFAIQRGKFLAVLPHCVANEYPSDQALCTLRSNLCRRQCTRFPLAGRGMGAAAERCGEQSRTLPVGPGGWQMVAVFFASLPALRYYAHSFSESGIDTHASFIL